MIWKRPLWLSTVKTAKLTTGTRDTTKPGTGNMVLTVILNFNLSLVAKKIVAEIPDAIVVINKTPKEWVDYDIYC